MKAKKINIRKERMKEKNSLEEKGKLQRKQWRNESKK